MENKAKIAYATSSRADYGIVRKYLKLINDDDSIDFSVLVTGSHLDKRFGYTVDLIRGDGFRIDTEVDLQIDNTTNASVLDSMARGLSEFGHYFENNKYDLIIVLGDRYEMMSVAIAAAMQNQMILHIHGGEVTYGNYDEFVRHCITKMSRFHFTSTEVYRQRVIQLGESPDRVFNLGSLGAENCQHIDLDKVIPDVYKMKKDSYFVVVFHPETITGASTDEQTRILLDSIQQYGESVNYVFIGTNADTHSDIISKTWKAYAEMNSNVIYIENMNPDSYLYLLKHSIALVGNSSSGIIEAPSLGTYTVNIGHRQDGRQRADSVIDVECNQEQIVFAMKLAMVRKQRKENIINPYYQPNASAHYYEMTKNILLRNEQEPKCFYDMFSIEDKHEQVK